MIQLKDLLQQADSCQCSSPEAFTVTEDTIKELHRTAMAGSSALPSDAYRTGMPTNFADRYHPPHPEDIKRLTGHLVDQIQSSKSSLHPIELAAMAGKRLIDIQPFDDANEETALLLMNQILISASYRPISIGPERQEAYHHALTISRKEYNMEPFSRLIAECVLEEGQKRVPQPDRPCQEIR